MVLLSPRKKTFCKYNQSISASITLEAAFIMPLIILMVFALIYLSFYLHDICKLQNQMNITLHQAGVALKHETDITTGKIKFEEINDRGVYYLLTGDTASKVKQLQSKLVQELSEGLLFAKISEVTIDVGKISLAITIKATGQVSLPIFDQLFSSLTKIKISGDYPIHNPAETIRRCEVILDTASEIKGVSKLKEKIEKFLH